MERIAFHLRIRDGKRDVYHEEHENVPEALERRISSRSGTTMPPTSSSPGPST